VPDPSDLVIIRTRDDTFWLACFACGGEEGRRLHRITPGDTLHDLAEATEDHQCQEVTP